MPDGTAARPHLRATRSVADGLLALAGGRPTDAAARLVDAVRIEEELERTYDAACLRLELARAHDASGETAEADAEWARAAAVLEPLGCVNPY